MSSCTTLCNKFHLYGEGCKFKLGSFHLSRVLCYSTCSCTSVPNYSPNETIQHFQVIITTLTFPVASLAITLTVFGTHSTVSVTLGMLQCAYHACDGYKHPTSCPSDVDMMTYIGPVYKCRQDTTGGTCTPQGNKIICTHGPSPLAQGLSYPPTTRNCLRWIHSTSCPSVENHWTSRSIEDKILCSEFVHTTWTFTTRTVLVSHLL